ncbi:glycosyl transferase family protein [Mycobacterium tuberculosis]|nr:glycosyl transferase family protein [Mycobacterium tuberculosis]
MAGDAVTVVLPCLNEEESLPAVLAAIPAGYRALVVDNNSTDDTATVAPATVPRWLSSRGPDTARRCMPVCSPRPPPS